jgi:predicted MFS family arabinose efflux permease
VEKKYKINPILVIIITVFIDMIGYGIIIPLLPFYADTFQAGSTSLGILIASFALMQFFFAPILGSASDRFGRKPLLIISLFISFIGFTFFSFANSYIILLLSRIIAGIATERAIAQAYIADITDKKTRTKQLGKIGAAIGAGFIIGPALGGALSVFGFSTPGYLAMTLTAINILFVFFFVPESNKNIKTHTKQENPSINYGRGILDTIKKPLIGSILLIYFIITVAFSAIPVIVPLLSIEYYAFTALDLSYIFIYIGIVQIILQGFLISKLTKKIGEEKLIVIGTVIMAMGIFLMPLFKNLLLFYFTNSLLAAGFGIMNATIPSFISKKAKLNEQGRFLGVAASIASIANIPGPLLGGLIVDYGGIVAPFLISALLLLLSFGISFRVYTQSQLNRIKDKSSKFSYDKHTS